ncbi:MAG TPA: GNAT family N-acetyltransferase [Mycobacteriales bacterium]|nr:GNAT family N-acetyltransferase [Mycobacteriales bacterium]
MAHELVWPRQGDERTRAAVHRLLHDVVAIGGAVGWVVTPDRAESDRWLDTMLGLVERGDGALLLVEVDGVAQAMARWRRESGEVFLHDASVEKVMVHPSARGLGLGRVVMEAIVESARAAGLELLMLGVRGNNHGAVALYESLGWRRSGLLPNAIAVGDDRWDQVQMVLELDRPAHVTLHGSDPTGLGSSDRR